ncbi:F-box only protein 3 [Varanus komodoensis]|nr:F-box only protein 3 [Varanus komodoensis]
MLTESVREEDLDAVEAQIGCKLPDDYRCSFRIHNGQKLVVPGLMGSMALSNHYRSEDLLDIDTAADGFQQRLGLKQCLPLTFCIHTGVSQYMALESVEGRNNYEIFYQCPDQMARNPSAIDMFITGSSYLEWFTTYVNNVVTGGFPIIRDQIFRYVHDKDCVATTGDITVSVSTSFLPELSSVHPPHYFFTYRIRCLKWGGKEAGMASGYLGQIPSEGGIFWQETSQDSIKNVLLNISYGLPNIQGIYCTHAHHATLIQKTQEAVLGQQFHTWHILGFNCITVFDHETNHNECAMDEDEDSTDTDEYEDRRRILDIPAPSGRCPRQT